MWLQSWREGGIDERCCRDRNDNIWQQISCVDECRWGVKDDSKVADLVRQTTSMTNDHLASIWKLPVTLNTFSRQFILDLQSSKCLKNFSLYSDKIPSATFSLPPPLYFPFVFLLSCVQPRKRWTLKSPTVSYYLYLAVQLSFPLWLYKLCHLLHMSLIFKWVIVCDSSKNNVILFVSLYIMNFYFCFIW